MSDLRELYQPIIFEQTLFSEALDNYDRNDPHRRQDELDDENTGPLVNAPLYDTSITNPIKKSNSNISEFPDYSDEVMSDYMIAKLLGKQIEIPSIIDLDTADNYVDFIKNSITSLIKSENEFNITNAEISEKTKQV
jgi:hypothetical protein|tara:strand:+ start:1830 stop:2240 length:411 start_codon:yes stop_codon:yes gene_type:complete